MIRIFNLKINTVLLKVFIGLFFCFFCFFSYELVSAEIGGGSDAGHDGSSCIDNVSNTYIELCNNGKSGGGASWRIYSAKDDEITIKEYRNNKNKLIAGGGVIRGCKKHGWYLRYAYDGIAQPKPKPGDNRYRGKQVGILSITGNIGTRNYYSSEMLDPKNVVPRRLIDDPKTIVKFNSWDAISIFKNGSVDLDVISSIGDDGKRLSWDEVEKIFSAMRDYDKASVDGFTMEKNSVGQHGSRENPGLGWFCFTPKSIENETNFYSKSGVKISGAKSGNGEFWSKLDETVSRTIQIDESSPVTLEFSQALLYDTGGIEPKSLGPEYDKAQNNYYTIFEPQKYGEHSVNKNVLVKIAPWSEATELSKKNNSKKMYKIVEDSSPVIIQPSELKDGESLKICQYINYQNKTFTPPDKYVGAPKERDSEACVEIVKNVPPSDDDFCSKVVDQTQDYGNDAYWSYVQNLNKRNPRDSGWPSLSGLEIPNGNDDLKSGLKMTKIIGGKGSVTGGSNNSVSVFAKPSDNIRIRHVLCFGSQAVKALDKDDAKKGERDRSYSKGGKQASEFYLHSKIGGHVHYNITDYHGEESRKHLFGLEESMSFLPDSNGKFIYPKGFNDSAEKSAWGAVFDAPLEGDNYVCKHENGVDYESNFYQVPGVHPSSDSRNSCRSNLEIDGSRRHPSEKADLAGRSLQHQLSSNGHQAWIGGKGERTFDWEKSRYDRRTFVDPNFTFGKPTSCGCNVISDFRLDIPRVYKQDLAIAGIKYGECADDGRCEKDCDKKNPLPKDRRESIYYDRECEPKGCIEFKNTRESVENSFNFWPLAQNNDGPKDKVFTNVLIPYNFKTEMSSAPEFSGLGAHPDGNVVFPGESVSINAKLKVLRRRNATVSEELLEDGSIDYATRTPETKTKLIAFTLDPSASKDSISSLNSQSLARGTESHISDRLPFGSKVIDVHKSAIYNKSGNLYGSDEENVDLDSIVVPDAVVGTKLCVMAAVYPADSHNIPDGDIPDNARDMHYQEPAMQENIMNVKRWRLSPVACRTIAKKPSLQSWNGGIIADGNISGAPAHKYSSAIGNIDILPESRAGDEITHFGSWSEYELIGAGSGQISGFGSGASMGYGFNLMATYNLPAGKKLGKNENLICNISQLTIANADYRNSACNPGEIGNSGISIDDTIRERLEGRYRNLVNGATAVTEINSDYNCSYDGSTYQSSLAGFACANNGVKYSKGIDINLGSAGPIQLGPITPADLQDKKRQNNTMVVDASGSVYIKNNINYGQQSTNYQSISSLPQLLIFAKNIYISSNVTNVDAWLIAENIYTCAEAHDGGNINNSISAAINDGSASGDSACGKQLRINGPVFVGSQANKGKLHLLRHAGAYPGGGSRTSGFNPANPVPDLLSDGSVTPAEIFNLRLDAYLWAYSQAERLTQAFVTYSRELPPRY